MNRIGHIVNGQLITGIGHVISFLGFVVGPDGGSIASGEEFTLRVFAGGLLSATSVIVDGEPSTNIVVISDYELKAVAGFIQEGSDLQLVVGV